MDTFGPAGVDATAHVIVDALDDDVEIGGPDGHHLQRVRRVRLGEVVTAADGLGAWRTYDVAAASSGSITLRATTPVVVEAPPWPSITLVFALTKGDGPESVVARGTELGVDRFEPVLTDHGVARPDPAKLAARLDRIGREAAMQSRRARLPEISALVPLATLDPLSLTVAGLGGGPLAVPSPGSGSGWRILVGPEGGLSQTELERLQGAARVGIGGHVLRATTAAIAVAAVAATARSEQVSRGSPHSA